MKSQLLFSITAEHRYFSDGICNALLIRPDADCIKLLRKYDLQYRHTDEGKVLVYSVGTQSDKALKDPDALFNFSICATDPAFDTYTRQAPGWPDKIYHFTNNAKAGWVSGSLLQSVSDKRPDQKQDGKLRGLISIYGDDLQGSRFTCSFDAAACIWKYYLLADKPAANQPVNYFVSGADTGFETIAGSSDEVSAALMNAFPDAAVALCVSTGEIRYHEMGVKSIQLLRNNTVVVSHLPNPGLKDNGTRIINVRTRQPDSGG